MMMMELNFCPLSQLKSKSADMKNFGTWNRENVAEGESLEADRMQYAT